MFLLSMMLIHVKVKLVSFEPLSLKFLLIDAMPLEKKSLDVDGKCLTLVEIKDLPLEEVLLVYLLASGIDMWRNENYLTLKLLHIRRNFRNMTYWGIRICYHLVPQN